MILALTTACPECAQQPGEPCIENGTLLDYFHAARLEAAMDEQGTKRRSSPITDDLIDSTGLF